MYFIELYINFTSKVDSKKHWTTFVLPHKIPKTLQFD